MKKITLETYAKLNGFKTVNDMAKWYGHDRITLWRHYHNPEKRIIIETRLKQEKRS